MVNKTQETISSVKKYYKTIIKEYKEEIKVLENKIKHLENQIKSFNKERTIKQKVVEVLTPREIARKKALEFRNKKR